MEKIFTILLVLMLVVAFIVALIGSIIKGLFELICGLFARCLVRNYNESGGDMFIINEHFCKVAFLNKRLIEEYKAKGLLK